MKLPEDFIHHEGTSRPQCWIRNETDDTAVIHQENYKAEDLRRLAKWCIEAAEYIEWQLQESTKNTKRMRPSVK